VKIFKETTIDQAVDILVSQIEQGVHSVDKKFIRKNLSEVFDIAINQEEKRVKGLKSRTSEIDKIKKQTAILQQKVKDIENWQQLANNQSDLGKEKIISLLRYIEPRPIQPGREIAYLMAFSEGANTDYLKAFLV